jgi:hypothetical protein
MYPRCFLACLSLVVSAFLAWHWGHSWAQGCKIVTLRQEASVALAEESAIVIWDARNSIQHFIRWASFATNEPDFGFLVPTPTQPSLAEVSDRASTYLEDLIKPHVTRRLQFTSFCLSSISCAKHDKSKSAREVRVLDEQRVGGFDAVVLEADDAKALNEWLNRYGYVADPELAPWLEPYVKNNWKITAFKIVRDMKTGKPVKTSPVHMSFAATKPFFPYREPTSNVTGRSHGRLLRVFFLSEQKMSGRRGALPWNAEVHWADRLDSSQIKRLAADLGFKEQNPIPSGAWLTTFHDWATQRSGDADVYFEPAPDQSPIRPAEIVESIVIPVEVIIGGIVLVLMFIARRFKRKSV